MGHTSFGAQGKFFGLSWRNKLKSSCKALQMSAKMMLKICSKRYGAGANQSEGAGILKAQVVTF